MDGGKCLQQNQPIWLIGGTQESREIAQEIIGSGLSCLVTVTTPEATFLYPDHPQLRVQVGRLQLSSLQEFVLQSSIRGIVDASHPYAVEISQQAISIASRYHLPYLRYERPYLGGQKGIVLPSFSDLLEGHYLEGKNVLLTLGCKYLPLFKPWQEKALLYARILPKLESLEVALSSGFSPDRLIAFRPPLSLQMEEALWKHWQINLVISKASGKAGGEAIKQQVAEKLDILLITIDRPSVKYPNQTNSLADIREFCQKI